MEKSKYKIVVLETTLRTTIHHGFKSIQEAKDYAAFHLNDDHTMEYKIEEDM